MKKQVRSERFPFFYFFCKKYISQRTPFKKKCLSLHRGGESVTDMTLNVESREYMATIKFDRERFLQSIREYRQQKREWQERINKQLDAKEEEIRRIKASHYYEIA